MQHLASIDFEDWYHDVEHVTPVDGRAFDRAFDRQALRVVDILAAGNTKATFFVLGKTAERRPQWIKDLVGAGHEIATHGYGHDRLTALDADAFRADVRRSIEVIGALTGAAPRGYRAPYFSLGAREADYAYDVLAELGIAYSSSVAPGRRQASRIALKPARVTTKHGVVVEVPAGALEVGGRSFSIAGGGFWRVLPLALIERGVAHLERDGRAMVMYLHPHELDPLPLQSRRGLRRDLYVNLGRASIADKLRAVLQRFRFGPIGDVVDGVAT